jgi:beta-glucanase (GH16 family)
MRSPALRLSTAALALAAPLVALVACVPNPTAAVSVVSLSANGTSFVAGSGVRATAVVKSTVATNLSQVVLAVRDSHGAVTDFPLVNNWPVSTTPAVLTQTKTFVTPGTYTYWVAYSRSGVWTDLAPKRSFSITPVSVPAPAPTPTPPPGAAWRLAFHDEFDGAALDTSKWATCYPRPGDMSCSNTGNGEAQWYKPGNVSVAAGSAQLEARREVTTSPTTGQKFQYSSGLIQSKPSFNFTYGYMETRMRLPKGSGFWPAFWTWPTSENWPPEIDAMEFYGDNPQLVYQTYHGACGTQQRPSATDWTTGWHTFAADWEPGSVKFYVDGSLRMTTTCSPTANMYLIANLAVANGVNAPAPTASTAFPSSLAIDYIRVWQH